MSQEELQRIQEQVHVWFNRGKLAYSRRNIDLSKMCLQRRYEWNKKLESFGLLPEELSIEPQTVFGDDFDSGTFEASGIPRKPFPFSGDSETALKLPVDGPEDPLDQV